MIGETQTDLITAEISEFVGPLITLYRNSLDYVEIDDFRSQEENRLLQWSPARERKQGTRPGD